jgi:RNA polymerase sigma-70 factor (ECF subfamily)
MSVARGLDGLSDEEVAAGAAVNVHHAFQTLVTRHRDRVYRLALRMLDNESDAEDITQETFLHLHEGLPRFRHSSRFRTWLWRIAVNEVLMLKRAQRRRPVDALEDAFPGFEDVGIPDASLTKAVDELVHRQHVAQQVNQAVAGLDEALASALVLRDLQQLSAKEAACVLGVTKETVRQRACRARLKLREQLWPLHLAA